MRFKTFLSEGIIQDINFESADGQNLLKLLHTSYSDAFNNKTKLYRGVTKTREWPYEELRKAFAGERTEQAPKPISLSTMYKISPEWEKFPNRLQSTILSVSPDEATGFGSNTYWVLPKNGARLAVAPTDFNYWNEWPFNIKYLKIEWFRNNFINFLSQLYVMLKGNGKNIDELVDYLASSRSPAYRNPVENWFEKHLELIVAEFKEKYKGKSNLLDIVVEKSLQNGKLHLGIEQFLLRTDAEKIMNVLEKEFGGDLDKMLKTFFSPLENNFSICTIKELDKAKKTSKSEVWTEAMCLYVEDHSMDQIVKEYRKVYGKK